MNMEAVSQVRTAGGATAAQVRTMGDTLHLMHRQIRRLQARMDELEGGTGAPG